MKKQHTPDERSSPAKNMASDPTGIPNLDTVLGGGLARRALVIVVGPPGSGKTTLANQIAFTAAHDGRRALVLTALSEPTDKLITHLRTFQFFDDQLVGDMVQFLSVQQFLERGLEALGDEIITIVRQAKAKVVVLDGFRGIRGADINPQAARNFLYDVGAKLSLLGTTTIITSEAAPHDPAFFPEATTADVIIGTHFYPIGVRQMRALEVIKVRGGALMPGLHGMEIGANGVVVYPRLEARVMYDALTPHTSPASDDIEDWFDDRAPFGLPELDLLLDGGLPRETNTLLVGSLGAGKTLLALHFALASARAGEPTLYLSFRENRQQLLRKAHPFALGSQLHQALAPGGGLILQRWAPVELNPDIAADRLLAAIDRAQARRLIVDGISELEHAVVRSGDASRANDYLAALVEALQQRRMTSLFVAEHPKVVASELDFSANPISVLAENVLLLQQVNYRAQLHRILSVVKMRFSAHDYMLREFTIAIPGGIHVLPPRESGETLLDGLAEQQGTTSRRAHGAASVSVGSSAQFTSTISTDEDNASGGVV